MGTQRIQLQAEQIHRKNNLREEESFERVFRTQNTLTTLGPVPSIQVVLAPKTSVLFHSCPSE